MRRPLVRVRCLRDRSGKRARATILVIVSGVPWEDVPNADGMVRVFTRDLRPIQRHSDRNCRFNSDGVQDISALLACISKASPRIARRLCFLKIPASASRRNACSLPEYRCTRSATAVPRSLTGCERTRIGYSVSAFEGRDPNGISRPFRRSIAFDGFLCFGSSYLRFGRHFLPRQRHPASCTKANKKTVVSSQICTRFRACVFT